MSDSGLIFSLVYISSATTPFGPEDLVELLKKCRENNEKLNVSGMLLHKDGNFLQVLEGEERTVRALYEKVALDPRHNRLNTLQEGLMERREFPDWSMGFRDLCSADVDNIPGFSHFLESRLTAADFAHDPSSAKKLLLLFKDHEKGLAIKQDKAHA